MYHCPFFVVPCGVYFSFITLNLAQVPDDYGGRIGSKPTRMKALVLEYMETIPRHYSHYAMASKHEYIDCASSVLNWYKGPTDVNEDGSISLCFLEWLDIKMGTSHYIDFYTKFNYYKGINNGRDYMHPALAGDTTTIVTPEPVVLYSYFLRVVSKYAIRFKDNTPDQCSTCNKLRADVKNANENDRPAIVKAWMAHKLEADKGYVNRAASISASRLQWKDVVLAVPNRLLDVVPVPSEQYLSRSNYTDFTQCDMGGGAVPP